MRIVYRRQTAQNLSRSWRAAGARVALVPTMGYLHAGHISLVKRARKWAGRTGLVVVSVYVNPTQFAPTEDLARYPRDLKRDAGLCRDAGVDVLFAPGDHDMYPPNPNAPYSTYVVEEGMAQGMEGSTRPTHFRGVCTVVAKLFNIVQPGCAIFGQKDYQQASVIRKMVADLNFPVRIIVSPTVRENDGLALSSRNQYLSPDERRQATTLWEAIQRVRQLLRGKDQSLSAASVRAELCKLIQSHPSARVDYISFFDSVSLKPVNRISRGTHLALAVYIGRTRLIDNARL